MKRKELLKKYSLSEATIRNWIKLGYIRNTDDFDEEVIKAILLSKTSVRRNKRNSLKQIIPEGYVNDKNIPLLIGDILNIQKKYGISNNEVLISIIERLLRSRKIPDEVYNILGTRFNDKDFNLEIEKLDLTYDDSDDFLGCLYMSLLSVGKKDTKGVFYTPARVAKKIVKSVEIHKKYKILDPGCGSGNFLILLYKRLINEKYSPKDAINMLYGYDIDNIAVLIAKINLYCMDKTIEYGEIHVECKDYLMDKIDEKYDLVLGNPPWGVKYTKKEKDAIISKYDKSFSRLDSFSQFIFRSFSVLKKDGVLGFVLPSSILNIATHESVRRELLNHQIVSIEILGREFYEIVTDVIIIMVKNCQDNKYSLYDGERINQEVFNKNPYHNFLIPSMKAKRILDKIEKYSHHFLDNNNSRFFMGIVTGDNSNLLQTTKEKNNENIFSGKEITKYCLINNNTEKFVVFDPNKFQQVADEKFYRLPKIIYKFIGNKLCFSVDTRGYLTLNSANNINILNSENIYYISAILNSRVTQLFFDEKYNTHKVLKNHIMSFPIYNFSDEIKNRIIKLTKENTENNYNEKIEMIIYKELDLDEEDILYLKEKY